MKVYMNKKMSKLSSNNYSVEFIESLNYPDFVGFINQWNVLPGAHVTLSKWVTFSKMDSSSKLLEIACTSGFQSRELAIYTDCTAKGIDISKYAIESAIYNKNKYALGCKLNYEVADGYTYEDNNKYTHISFGASLRFFPEPEKMLIKAINHLENNGYILVSPFYATKKIPKQVIEKSKNIFGIIPTHEDYKQIMRLYKNLEIIYQDHNELIIETESELQHYCTSIVDRACITHGIKEESVIQAIYERLLNIRKMTNELRQYQKYTVLVLRFRWSVYPDRYIELF